MHVLECNMPTSTHQWISRSPLRLCMQMLQRNITLEGNPKAFSQFAASMHNDENTDGRRAMC